MIENTSNRDAFIHLLGAMSDGTEGYITGMEAAGQRELVASEQLPKDGPWDDLIALGFTRGQGNDADDLFVNATLPEGWRKEPTDHSMWSQIVDARGIKRVSVFYKAAFYDRRAFFRIDNLGDQFASDAAWGDGPVKLPEWWDLLTDAEKAECATQLQVDLAYELDKRKWLVDNAEGMRISEAHVARIEAFIALIPAIDRQGTPE